MSLTKFENDMSIIRKESNQVIKQADRLKAEFDRAGEEIKEYINDTLTTEIDAEFEKKVDKENGKDLSSNDYTDEEKEKLGGLPDSADLNNRMNLKANKEEMDALLAGKVDKVEGKGLSSNDYTDEEKEKLGGLPDSADLNNRMNLKADKEKMESLLAGKVDKEDGKGLSSNDFSDNLKDKLDNLYSREEIDLIEETLDDGIADARGIAHTAHGRIDTLSEITDENFGMLVNSLKGEADGENLILSDISAAESDLEITLSGDMEDFSSVNVTARGQNLLNPNVYSEPQTQYGVTLKYIPEEDVFCLDGTCTDAIGNVEFTTKLPELIKVDKNKEYIVTVELVSGTTNFADETISKVFYVGCGDYEGQRTNFIDGNLKGKTNRAAQPKYNYLTYVWIYKIINGDSFDNFKFRIQISEKEFYNDYEKWTPQQTVKAQADGTVKGLKSVYPVTFIDTDQEVNINCRYNRDINKAFAELQQAIISLGGNV